MSALLSTLDISLGRPSGRGRLLALHRHCIRDAVSGCRRRGLYLVMFGFEVGFGSSRIREEGDAEVKVWGFRVLRIYLRFRDVLELVEYAGIARDERG